MASFGKVTIKAEHLLKGDGTLYRALELWSCRNGPVPQNQWQSLYWGLIRDHGYHDEFFAGRDAGPVVRQARIRNLWQEIQQEQHGDDHAADALVKYKLKRAEAVSAAEGAAASAESQAVGEPAQRQMSVVDNAFGGSAALGRHDPIAPPPAETFQRYGVDYVPDEGNTFGGDGFAALPNRNLAEEFSVATPRNSSPVPTSMSPDKLLLRQEGELAWEADGCARTEQTDVLDARHEVLAAQLSAIDDATQEEVEFIIWTDIAVTDWRAGYKAWVGEDPPLRGATPIEERRRDGS
jgi:hypothetical protein